MILLKIDEFCTVSERTDSLTSWISSKFMIKFNVLIGERLWVLLREHNVQCSEHNCCIHYLHLIFTCKSIILNTIWIVISFNPDWLHLDNVATSLSLSLSLSQSPKKPKMARLLNGQHIVRLKQKEKSVLTKCIHLKQKDYQDYFTGYKDPYDQTILIQALQTFLRNSRATWEKSSCRPGLGVGALSVRGSNPRPQD
jgi:hypothetical protein